MNMQSTLPSIHELKKVYIIGICGTLMGAFAAYLKRNGVEVVGSDQNVYPPMSDVLRDAGVELKVGYSASNLTSLLIRPDLIVIGNVIRSDNPEARAAIEGGYLYSSLPEAMEKLCLQKTRNLVVAGTHGKTTTSSLLAHVLTQCKREPSYFIGGVSQDLPFSFQLNKLEPGSLFVLEGDEYDTSFWDKVPKFNHYLPDDVILTSIEYDHADIYADLQAVVRAFEGLVSRVRPGGRMIACYDYATIRELLSRASFPVISYGSSRETQATYTPGNVQLGEGYTRFEVLKDGTPVDEVLIQLPGMHNILNALSVWVECRELGLDAQLVQKGFKSFRGVKRRQEVRAEINGITVIDDFAHHPTAVRETLRALRAKYPQKRCIAVFEPRSATSRRKIFQNDYSLALQEADGVFISAPYDQTRILAENQFSSEVLVQDLLRQGKEACLMKSVDEGVQEVYKRSRSGDLIAVLSNGGFEGFIPKLLKLLQS